MAYSSKTIMYGVSHVMNSQIHLMQQLALQSPSFSLNPVHHKLALCVTPSPLYLLTLLPVVHKNQKAMTGPRSSLFPFRVGLLTVYSVHQVPFRDCFHHMDRLKVLAFVIASMALIHVDYAV